MEQDAEEETFDGTQRRTDRGKVEGGQGDKGHPEGQRSEQGGS